MIEELTSQQKAALVAWHLFQGNALTARDVMDITGLSRQGAHALLCLLSEILPIYSDGSAWRVVVVGDAPLN